MPDLENFDAKYDIELLENSYKAIQNKDCLEIVTDKSEKKSIHDKAHAALTIPNEASFSFQNLFKLTFPNGKFYIAQSLFDFGYPVGRRLSQSPIHKYYFQVIGIADLQIDLGRSFLREETKTDKIVGWLFGNDIDLEGADSFNGKYYLVSDKRETVVSSFDNNFLNTLAKYEDIILVTKGTTMLITLGTEIEENHSRIIEDVFSNCKFLKK